MLVYHPNDWRLFLDTSKHRLKCALFHNGKVYSAVPVGHFVYLRKEHNDIKTMIDLLKYHEHNWTTGMPYAIYCQRFGCQSRKDHISSTPYQAGLDETVCQGVEH